MENSRVESSLFRPHSSGMITTLAFGMPAAPEWIFIAILALVLFGPKKIPELARGIGKALGELQRAKEDFHREITGVPKLPKIQSSEGLESVAYPDPAAKDDASKPADHRSALP
jgi:sec-independent protein translocase protein TatA